MSILKATPNFGYTRSILTDQFCDTVPYGKSLLESPKTPRRRCNQEVARRRAIASLAKKALPGGLLHGTTLGQTATQRHREIKADRAYKNRSYHLSELGKIAKIVSSIFVNAQPFTKIFFRLAKVLNFNLCNKEKGLDYISCAKKTAVFVAKMIVFFFVYKLPIFDIPLEVQFAIFCAAVVIDLVDPNHQLEQRIRKVIEPTIDYVSKETCKLYQLACLSISSLPH